jgi:hypothetical protein
MRHSFNCTAVHDIILTKAWQNAGVCSGLCSSSVSSLSGARPLLSRQILLGKSLLPRFAFPIIVTNSPTIHDDTAAKLTEHGSSGYDRNLARSVRVRKDVLLNKIIFFDLTCDNFE